MGELWSKVEALETEVRQLNEHVLANQWLQPHRFNEMAQDKISTSREVEERPALTNSQTPSSSELRAQVQEEVLPQALCRAMIHFGEKRKQLRERNAAPNNPGETK
ncbi:hypothetical protein SLEP1_g40679 [Rubroshorea leprosula]|uniref:Uncharacterized protein n=1 Tax=Rubroshorea leprosula TaxID=152421 RepID=A0AAV5L4J4_9ROSI|nr:hypothetical protein SLEP1_g40679 [Rubroshorea leprosula]